MTKVWNHFFVLIWIVYLLSAGIYLFSKGFLLTRRVQTQRNTCVRLKNCDDLNDDPNCLNQYKVEEILSNVNSSSEYCLPKKSKVILLVVDALKYEFGVYKKDKIHPLPYENKLPIFNELLTKYPNNARLFKFLADPPTTTLQRLKGITTGSLPTFIDIGSNFATSEINEDNIIDQVVSSNLSAVFLGDSTWTELFPKRFLREYSFPSFNIFDLDSVDASINERLPEEQEKNDWSLLIAHYLGVDHCGHKYGPIHSEMARKLTEMNTVIQGVVERMDDDTTLMVIGDHGMTVTGDHGGATEDEVSSLLFAYTKKHHYLTNSGDTEMEQIDLVPTMATILGIPIPYSNLGSLNLDIVPSVPEVLLSNDVIKMLHTWQNAIQVRYFFSNYTQDHRDTFKSDMLEDLYTKFYILTMRISSLYTNAALDNFSKDVRLYLKDVLIQCRMIWVRFEPNYMSQGLLFTAVVNIFVFLLIINMKFHQFEVVFATQNLAFIYGSNILLAVAAYLLHDRFGIESSEQCILVATCVYSISLMAFLIVQNWDIISMNWSQQKHFSNLVSRIILGFSVTIYYSNSFVIGEQNILCYLLCGVLVVFLYNVRKQSVRLVSKSRYRLASLLSMPYVKLAIAIAFGISLLRFCHTFHRCREEHGNCTEFGTQSIHATDRKSQSLYSSRIDALQLFPMVPLITFAILSQMFLRKCGNLSGQSVGVLIARYGPGISAISCGANFFMTAAKNTKLGADISQVTIDASAWLVFSIFALQTIVLLHRPLLLFVLQRSTNRSIDVSPFGRVVPQLFMKMKRMYEDGSYGINRSSNDDEDRIPIVYGLATVYSSVFWSTLSTFIYVLAVLLGPFASHGLFIAISIAALILVLNAFQRYQTSSKLDPYIQPELLTLLAWSLLIHYSFFATSHQTTLSQIDWHAAFVGRSASYDNNNILSAILILLNTFGGTFLITLLYPLLVITSTAIYAVFPSLTNKKVDSQGEKTKRSYENIQYQPICIAKNKRIESEQEGFDIGKGELTLYENDDILFGSIFKVACQLIILQGMRIFSSMLACTIHCRHLMVWKIFAPRFIYEGIATYIMFAALLIGFLLVIRINAAVDRFMTRMSSNNN